MNILRNALLSASLAALLLPSCKTLQGEIELRDLSFEIGSELVWSPDYLAWTLRLGVESGEAGDYLFNYIVDDDPLVKLRTSGGGTLESGLELALSDKGAKVFLLPRLTSGRSHVLSMEFSREGVSRTYSITLPDTSVNGIGVSIEASPDKDFSYVTLWSVMGASVTSYNVTFLLDGELLSGIKYMGGTFGGAMTLDFSDGEPKLFEMPYLFAGEHVLRVEVRSSLGSESTQISFTEPQRKRIDLHFYYNDYSGRLMVESSYNPLGTVFEITADISVSGTITYREPQFFGIADPTTENFSVSGEASARVTPGVAATAFDGGKLRSLLDEIYSITREDAANAIGNGNRKTLHTDITGVTLRLTVHSLGDFSGKAAVTLTPSSGNGFPIKYTYAERTPTREGGTLQVIYPTYTVNGKSPSSISTL